MKFRNFARTLPALAGAAGLALSLSSCSNNRTVGYAYVMGTSAQGQPAGMIGEFREDNNFGSLTGLAGSPIGSGGLNPTRAVIPSGNRFFYALNAGTASTDANATTSSGAANPLQGTITGFDSSNITLFTIGGFGQLSPQLSYNPQGYGPIRVLADSAGAHLFVLTRYVNPGLQNGVSSPPSQVGQSADYPCQDETNPAIFHPVGAITVFSIDGATGRLGVQQNQRQQNLTYFPVGCNPVDFRIAGQYLYTMDAGSPTNNDVQTVFIYAITSTTGQLTPTQTSTIAIAPVNNTTTNSTGSTANITAITGDATGRYVYLLDTTFNQGTGAPVGRIFLFTVGTSGALTAVTGSPYISSNDSQAGGPVQTVTDSASRFVYAINQGPAGGTANANSDVSGFSINSATGFFDSVTQQSPYAGVVSGPVCIFEDPTNQYLYSAGALDNSITGRRIDPNTGVLTPLRRNATVPTVGTPSWCLGISSVL